ncbi:unnamed protein product [Fusarium graminearum]|nr:hypothetical protein HG531_000620 [Fusarium graminearum]CZS82316.1 unnamed protein product [Fusarium graminearum]
MPKPTGQRSADTTQPNEFHAEIHNTTPMEHTHSFLLLSVYFLSYLSQDIHELTGSNSRQNMPPPMELEKESPRQPDLLAISSQLVAKLKVDVPNEVPEEAGKGSSPYSYSPLANILCGKCRLGPVEKVSYTHADEDKRNPESNNLVDDL